jgi:thiol-disulfide isomerase/thioredoxin
MKALAWVVALFVAGYIGLHFSPAGRRAINRMRQEAVVSAEKTAPSDATAAPPRAQPENKEAQRLVESSDQPLLLVFWQPNCPGCDRMEPMVTTLEQGFSNFRVLRINTRLAENQKLHDDFRIRGTPTFVVTRSGMTLRRNEGGFRTLDEFISFVRPAETL